MGKMSLKINLKSIQDESFLDIMCKELPFFFHNPYGWIVKCGAEASEQIV
jgi:formiminotetrahydrofolate cyclodeaminase